jgi:hypothetical protein
VVKHEVKFRGLDRVELDVRQDGDLKSLEAMDMQKTSRYVEKDETSFRGFD